MIQSYVDDFKIYFNGKYHELIYNIVNNILKSYGLQINE